MCKECQQKQFTIQDLEKKVSFLCSELAERDFKIQKYFNEIKSLKRQIKEKDQQLEKSKTLRKVNTSTSIEDQLSQADTEVLSFKTINKNQINRKMEGLGILDPNTKWIQYKKSKSSVFQREQIHSPHVDQEQQQKTPLLQVLTSNSLNLNKKIQALDKFLPLSESDRNNTWKYLIKNNLKITKELYETLKQKQNTIDEEVLHSINNDLVRIYNPESLDETKNQEINDLREILIIFSLYRPDIGYAQGMHFILKQLFSRMNKYQAFKALSNIMFGSKMLKNLYSFNNQKIQKHIELFELGLKENEPELFHHMKKQQITPGVFLYEWLYTLYSRSLNQDLVTQIWDRFLIEGDQSLIKTAITLINIMKPSLIKTDYEKFITVIKDQSCNIDCQLYQKEYKKVKLSFQNIDNFWE